jgi:hypothetical protein
MEEGKPCHDIFQYDLDLLCYRHVEVDFYNISRPCMAITDFFKDHLMCCICASTSHDADGGQIHVDLKTGYSLVLPSCATCKSQGANIIVVGRYAPNGKALLKRLVHDKNTAAKIKRERPTTI